MNISTVMVTYFDILNFYFSKSVAQGCSGKKVLLKSLPN